MTQKISLFALILGLGLLVSSGANAGTFPYILNISDGSGPAGGLADVSFSTDNTGLGYTGWGWGVCQGGEGFATIDSVANGADAGALNDGDGPEFNAVTLLPNGWTVGAIVELVGNGQLLPGIGLEMHVGSYLTSAEGTETLSYCSTLGSPPVIITLTLDGGGVADETTGDLQLNGGSATGTPPDFYKFILSTENGSYAFDTGAGANVTATHSIEAQADGGGINTQGFSLGLAQDGPCLLVAGDPTGVLAAINDGDGPEFFGSNLAPVGGPGFTVGVVYALLGGSDIAYDAGVPTAVIALEYDPDDGTLAGNAGPFLCNLLLSDLVGDPPVVNTVVNSLGSVSPSFCDGSITLTAVVDVPHIRGDCNDDGIVNIADAIASINELFVGGTPSNCQAACDTNDDGMHDGSDPIYTLNYRFLGGPPPPAPFPDCGTRMDADCDEYNSC